jgi:flagellar basal body-associated protein FliL
MAKGLVWGILALLSVVVSVLAGVVAFFVHVGKRSALAQGEKEAGSLLESTDKVS